MTALAQDRKTSQVDPNSAIPQLHSFPAEASTKLYGGGMVATNAAGNAVPASASTALKVWGRCERQTDNSAGAAGALQVPVRMGAFKYNNSTGGDAIAVANRGQACYAADDNTLALTDGGGTRPYAGVIIGVDSAGQVAAIIGQTGPYASVAQDGQVQRMTVDIPLATIQGETSGTAFNVGAALPANARVLASEINVLTALSGGSAASATATLQAGTDAAGSMIASTSVFTGAKAVIATPGSDPYASRGGQQVQMTITGDGTHALSTLTAGHLSVDIFYVEV